MYQNQDYIDHSVLNISYSPLSFATIYNNFGCPKKRRKGQFRLSWNQKGKILIQAEFLGFIKFTKSKAKFITKSMFCCYFENVYFTEQASRNVDQKQRFTGLSENSLVEIKN